MHERHDKRGNVFSEKVKHVDCSLSDAIACPKIIGKLLSLKCRKQDYDSGENNKVEN